MIEILLSLITALLCLVGLTEIIHTVRLRLLCPKTDLKTEMYIYLDGENADLRLCCLLRRLNRADISKIEAVYIGENEKEKEICKKIAERNDIIFR